MTSRIDLRDSSGQDKSGKPCGKGFIPKDHDCHISESLAQKTGDIGVEGARVAGWAALAAGSLTGNKTLLAAGLLTVGGAIAAGVIKDTIEDKENYAQFAEDRLKAKQEGIPKRLRAAYDHANEDLALSLYAAENRIKNNTYETLYLFDKKGVPIVIRRGGNASARLSFTDTLKANQFVNKGVVITHNHPYAGGTFSPTDINTSGNVGASEIRATTGKEIYVLRPKKEKVFNQSTNAGLAQTYQAEMAPTLMKSYGKFLNKRGFLGKLYYSTVGGEDKKLIREVSADVEFDIHKALKRTIDSGFSESIDYKRVPRSLNPKREENFKDELASYRQFAKKIQEELPASKMKTDAVSVEESLRGAIAEIYPDPVKSLAYSLQGDVIVGRFDGDQPYTFEISPEGLFSYNEVDPSRAVYMDSYQEAVGVRGDRQSNCLRGKPCGGTCVARGYKCSHSLTAPATAALSNVRQALSKGNRSSNGSDLGSRTPFNQDPEFAKKLAIAGLTVGAVAATIGAASIVVQNDLKKSSIPFDSIRQPPGGIPDDQTLATYDTFQPGDLIRKGFVSGNLGTRQHYAVYIGKDPKTGDHMMIDTAEDWKSRDKSPMVMQRGLTWNAGPNDTEYEKVPESEMHLKPETRRLTREEIVDRANKMLYQRFEYKGFQSNCESFARGMVEGVAYSAQADKISPLTNFLSQNVTSNVLKLRTSNPWFPTATGVDFGKSWKTPIGISKGGEKLAVTGWSETAFQKHKMTAQQMTAHLEAERVIELRRTAWAEIPNPYDIQNSGGDPREYAKYAQAAKVYTEAAYSPPKPKPKERTLQKKIFGATLKITLTDPPKNDSIASNGAAPDVALDVSASDINLSEKTGQIMAGLGLKSPDQYTKAVEIVAQKFPSMANSIRSEMYANYLMMVFGLLNPPKQVKSDAEAAENKLQLAIKETQDIPVSNKDKQAAWSAFLVSLRQIIGRSYTSGFDRFLKITIDGDETTDPKINGFFQAKDKVVEFHVTEKSIVTKLASIGDLKKDAWLEVFSENLVRQDELHLDKKDQCVKGLSCGESCISRNKTCTLQMSKLASSREIAALMAGARRVRSIMPPSQPSQAPSQPVAQNSETPAPAQPVSPKPDPLDEMNIRQLKKEAKGRSVYRYSEMTKEELKESIRLADRDPKQQDRIAKTIKRTRETPINLRPLRLTEKSPPEKALTDAVKKWNRIARIMQLAGVEPQLLAAGVGAIALGVTIQTYNRMRDKYRRNLPDSAASAIERADKMQMPYSPRNNITFAVGGFSGTGSTSDKIVSELKSRAEKDGASEADKWFRDKHDFIAVDNKEFDFDPVKLQKKNQDGSYNPLYLASASTKAFGAYLRNFRRGRNETAVELAAKIYAYGNVKDKKTGRRYINKNKTINIVAHDVGGNTVSEAMEILSRMNAPRRLPGRQIREQINVIKLGTTDFGYTEKGLVRERTITSALDPYSFLPMRNEKWISGVRGHEIKDYLRNDDVYDQVLQSSGFYSRTSYQRDLQVRNKDSFLIRLDRDLVCKIGKRCGNACVPEGSECKTGNGVAKTAALLGGSVATGVGATLLAQHVFRDKNPSEVGSLSTKGIKSSQKTASVGQKSTQFSVDPLTKSVAELALEIAKDPELRHRLIRNQKVRRKLVDVGRHYLSATPDNQSTKKDTYLESFRSQLHRDQESDPQSDITKSPIIRQLLARAIAPTNRNIAQVLSIKLEGKTLKGMFSDRKRRVYSFEIDGDRLSFREVPVQSVAPPSLPARQDSGEEEDHCVEGTDCGHSCVKRGSQCHGQLSEESQAMVSMVKKTIETEELPSRAEIAGVLGGAVKKAAKEAIRNPIKFIREGNQREKAAREALRSATGIDLPKRAEMARQGAKAVGKYLDDNPHVKNELIATGAGVAISVGAGTIASPVASIAVEAAATSAVRRGLNDLQALQTARKKLQHDEAFQVAGRLDKLKMLRKAAIDEVHASKAELHQAVAGDIGGAIAGGIGGTIAGNAAGHIHPLLGLAAGLTAGVTTGIKGSQAATSATKKVQSGQGVAQAAVESTKEVVDNPNSLVRKAKEGQKREEEVRRHATKGIRSAKRALGVPVHAR